MDLLLVLGWGAMASLALFFGLLAGSGGAHKGRNGCAWFVMGALCGPVALIALIAIPSRELPQLDQSLAGSGTGERADPME